MGTCLVAMITRVRISGDRAGWKLMARLLGFLVSKTGRCHISAIIRRYNVGRVVK